MKKMIAMILMSVFLASCATRQLEAKIDEQSNLLLAKSHQVSELKAEIAKRDQAIAELKAEQKKLKAEFDKLSIKASYAASLEQQKERLISDYEALEARVAELEAEKAKLSAKLKKVGDKYVAEEFASAVAEANGDDELTIEGYTEDGERVVVVEKKSEKKFVSSSEMSGPDLVAPPYYPVAPPMPGMMPGMPSMAMGMSTFQPFPASVLGHTYSPPPDSAINIHLSSSWANEETYFLVKVDGKEIQFATEPPRVYKEGGKAHSKSLLPPGVDAYIPVDSVGTFTVKVQGCRMSGKVCVPIKSCKARKVEDATNFEFLLYECD